jgi:hypothetical protein
VAILTPTVPHFDLPFRFTTQGHPVVVEQDSVDDVSNCVQAIMLTVRGTRTESPDFGISDLTFEKQPISLDDVSGAIDDQEPRARYALSQKPDLVEQLAAILNIDVSTQEVTNS